jgi:hypothetical protein
MILKNLFHSLFKRYYEEEEKLLSSVIDVKTINS